MTALAAERNTKERIGDVFDLPVKANTKCYLGGLAVIDAGYAAPGRTATTLVAAGRFEESVDNTGGAAGDKKARVKRGIYKFANSAAGDLIAQADVGADCYIVDDQTVAKTNGTNTRSRAGQIVAVDSDGVWVQIGLGW
ncbi:hypothetical protein [Methylococcus mesophilus]|uniref:hypothetical protein n=1 Tax=Methylococcus mesophilus TaxID=2993564 RepID=UPI00224B4EF2|nr:hypothetical protein [Methylococcus mesophilus]UZR27473.1 hypothetical protein OOT43_12085 [Methylococcus mesophilus]